MKSSADLVAEGLATAGVRHLFGYIAGPNARLIEALHGSSAEFVAVAHEASAGFMADVSSRLTGRVGACLSTLGPGATNMSTGVGNAFLDRVPLLAITAQVGRLWKGRTTQMHIDHRRLYSPISKWSAELETGSIGATMKKAVEIAMAEQPGPVHLDLPEDTAEELSDEVPAVTSASPPPLPPFDRKALEKAAALIRKARYPLVAVGLTMNRAQATGELREFVGKHRLPVVTTLMAKGQVPEEGPDLVGVLGRARRELVAEYYAPADLVIAIGYDPVEFNYEEWMRKDLPLIHIDTVPADIAGGYSVACQLVGNIREILKALLPVPELRHQWDPEALRAHRRRLYRALTPTRKRFSPHHAVLAMRQILPKDGLLCVDVGAHTHLIGQLWKTAGPGNFLVSNGWSSMGFAIPAAIAARLAQPGRPVLACVGDGGFLMSVGEINTAVRLRLAVVIVLLRDNTLSLIKARQARRGYHFDGVELFGPGYRSSDNFFGARVIVAECEEEFREALKRGLSGSEPVVIEAVVDPAEYERIL
ncbi:MAG: thiamine pyrophosphate-binding protein [Syntrophales bacterium]